jgi:hypothetical protein
MGTLAHRKDCDQARKKVLKTLVDEDFFSKRL